MFIERLLETLEKKGISQYKMCKDLQIGQSTISSWKKGKMPTIDKLILIVQYLEISADYLLGLSDMELRELNQREKEMLKNFNDLPEEEQIRFLGRIEEIAERYKKSLDTQAG